MLKVGSITPAGAHEITSPAFLFQRPLGNRSQRQSPQDPLAPRESSAQPTQGGSTILWLALGAFFLAMVFGYPLLLSIMGDSHGLRFLLRLGSSFLLLIGLSLFVAVAHWLTKR